MLKLKNKTFYTGSTPDLKHRLSNHTSGKVESTKLLRPIKLVWYAAFTSRLLARRFENYLKSGSGQAFRNKRFLNKNKK